MRTSYTNVNLSPINDTVINNTPKEYSASIPNKRLPLKGLDQLNSICIEKNVFEQVKDNMVINLSEKYDIDPQLSKFLEDFKFERSKLSYLSKFSDYQVEEISKMVKTEHRKIQNLLKELDNFHTTLTEYKTQMNNLKKATKVNARNKTKNSYSLENKRGVFDSYRFRPYYNKFNNPDFYKISSLNTRTDEILMNKTIDYIHPDSMLNNSSMISDNMVFQSCVTQNIPNDKTFLEDGEIRYKKNWHNLDDLAIKKFTKKLSHKIEYKDKKRNEQVLNRIKKRLQNQRTKTEFDLTSKSVNLNKTQENLLNKTQGNLHPQNSKDVEPSSDQDAKDFNDKIESIYSPGFKQDEIKISKFSPKNTELQLSKFTPQDYRPKPLDTTALIRKERNFTEPCDILKDKDLDPDIREMYENMLLSDVNVRGSIESSVKGTLKSLYGSQIDTGLKRMNTNTSKDESGDKKQKLVVKGSGYGKTDLKFKSFYYDKMNKKSINKSRDDTLIYGFVPLVHTNQIYYNHDLQLECMATYDEKEDILRMMAPPQLKRETHTQPDHTWEVVWTCKEPSTLFNEQTHKYEKDGWTFKKTEIIMEKKFKGDKNNIKKCYVDEDGTIIIGNNTHHYFMPVFIARDKRKKPGYADYIKSSDIKGKLTGDAHRYYTPKRRLSIKLDDYYVEPNYQAPTIVDLDKTQSQAEFRDYSSMIKNSMKLNKENKSVLVRQVGIASIVLPSVANLVSDICLDKNKTDNKNFKTEDSEVISIEKQLITIIDHPNLEEELNKTTPNLKNNLESNNFEEQFERKSQLHETSFNTSETSIKKTITKDDKITKEIKDSKFVKSNKGIKSVNSKKPLDSAKNSKNSFTLEKDEDCKKNVLTIENSGLITWKSSQIIKVPVVKNTDLTEISAQNSPGSQPLINNTTGSLIELDIKNKDLKIEDISPKQKFKKIIQNSTDTKKQNNISSQNNATKKQIIKSSSPEKIEKIRLPEFLKVGMETRKAKDKFRKQIHKLTKQPKTSKNAKRENQLKSEIVCKTIGNEENLSPTPKKNYVSKDNAIVRDLLHDYKIVQNADNNDGLSPFATKNNCDKIEDQYTQEFEKELEMRIQGISSNKKILDKKLSHKNIFPSKSPNENKSLFAPLNTNLEKFTSKRNNIVCPKKLTMSTSVFNLQLKKKEKNSPKNYSINIYSSAELKTFGDIDKILEEKSRRTIGLVDKKKSGSDENLQQPFSSKEIAKVSDIFQIEKNDILAIESKFNKFLEIAQFDLEKDSNSLVTNLAINLKNSIEKLLNNDIPKKKSKEQHRKELFKRCSVATVNSICNENDDLKSFLGKLKNDMTKYKQSLKGSHSSKDSNEESDSKRDDDNNSILAFGAKSKSVSSNLSRSSANKGKLKAFKNRNKKNFKADRKSKDTADFEKMKAGSSVIPNFNTKKLPLTKKNTKSKFKGVTGNKSSTNIQLK